MLRQRDFVNELAAELLIVEKQILSGPAGFSTIFEVRRFPQDQNATLVFYDLSDVSADFGAGSVWEQNRQAGVEKDCAAYDLP